MDYTPPAWQEWLAAAAILAAGLLCLRIGLAASRGSAWARNAAAATGLLLAVGGGAAHYPPLRELAGPWLRIPGGEAAIACLGASVLLGLLWADRRRSLSRPLLAVVTALVRLAAVLLRCPDRREGQPIAVDLHRREVLVAAG